MKHPKITHFTRFIPIAISCIPALSTAGSDSKEIVPEITPAAVSPWEFRLEPYGWLTGLDGTVGFDGITADVDANFFSEVARQLKMAAALQFEARYGSHWGITVDGFYAALGDSGNPSGELYQDVSVNLKQFIGQATVSYRLYESPKGFIDVYAGARYNLMQLDLGAVIDPAGVQSVSTNASSEITTAVDDEAQAIVDPRIQEYQTATQDERAIIEAELEDSIRSDAGSRVRDKIEDQLLQIRSDNSLPARAPGLDRLVEDTKKETAALAEATADLKIAQLRASVDSTLQGDVTKAEKQVAKADKALAGAIDTSLSETLPENKSTNENWVDPIIGFRGQYNINDKWYLAGSADIGGFGLSSDITWSLQATVGYNFTQKVSAEFGYRYLYTDYSNSGFVYDVAQAGMFAGLNYKF